MHQFRLTIIAPRHFDRNIVYLRSFGVGIGLIDAHHAFEEAHLNDN